MNKIIVLLIGAFIGAEAAFSLGNIESRIINGQLATANQFPWHVTIQGTLPNGQTTLCGGALISNAFAITAAHCVTK